MRTPLQSAHSDLQAAWQECLLCTIGLELEATQHLFLQVASDLRAHLKWEDQHLFPVYDRLVPDKPRGAPIVLLDSEHRRVEQWLDSLGQHLEVLVDNTDHPQLRYGVLRWLQDALKLQELLDHHERREESMLLPALTLAMGEDAVLELLRGLPEPLAELSSQTQ